MKLDEHYEKLKDQMTREEFDKMVENLDKFAHYAFDRYKEWLDSDDSTTS